MYSFKDQAAQELAIELGIIPYLGLVGTFFRGAYQYAHARKPADYAVIRRRLLQAGFEHAPRVRGTFRRPCCPKCKSRCGVYRPKEWTGVFRIECEGCDHYWWGDPKARQGDPL